MAYILLFILYHDKVKFSNTDIVVKFTKIGF